MNDLPIIDAHLHFWRIGGPGQVWPDADWPLLHRDYLPDDLRMETEGVDLRGAILIQSQPDDRDTDWMIDLVADDPLMAGVVGWVALDRADAAQRIATLTARPKLVGLRPMLQGMAETDWILRPELDPAIEAMMTHGLRFDALIEPRHLPVIARFADRWPDLPIVVNHGGKPDAANAVMDPWREQLGMLSTRANVWCKLSGLRTQQAQGQAAGALQPYARHIIDCFGDRVMWGSDWPVLRHMGDRYGDWIDDGLALAEPLDEVQSARLFEGAAREFYGLEKVQ